jgi:hypothetical protein
VVESHGDYRAEAYLEDHIGGKLYSQQRSLPRLPVPNISDTITKLMPTALPLAKSDEEKATFIKACEEFEGQAGELQRRLVGRKEGEMKDSSWLQHWWNTLGYLQVSLLFIRHPEQNQSRPRGFIPFISQTDLISHLTHQTGSRSRGGKRILLLSLLR